MGRNDSFEKLDEENYVDWAWQMKAHLVSKDLWDVVDGSEGRPMGSEGSRAVKAFRKKQRLACAEIILHVDKSQRAHTRDDDPAIVWTALESNHQARGLSSRMALLRLFFSSVMSAEQTVSSWIAHVKDLAYRLEDDKFKVPEEIIIYVLTAGLPHEEFKHFVSSLDNVSQSDLTLDLVITRLLNEDAGQRAQTVERPNTISYSARATKSIVCFFCNKRGHYASDCPAKKLLTDRTSKETGTDSAAFAEPSSEMAGLAISSYGHLAI